MQTKISAFFARVVGNAISWFDFSDRLQGPVPTSYSRGKHELVKRYQPFCFLIGSIILWS